jgi:uncharacterized membrane protein
MTADLATIAAARQLLDQLGITMAHLAMADLQTAPVRAGVPTVTEYVGAALRAAVQRQTQRAS